MTDITEPDVLISLKKAVFSFLIFASTYMVTDFLNSELASITLGALVVGIANYVKVYLAVKY